MDVEGDVVHSCQPAESDGQPADRESGLRFLLAATEPVL
jgi:hypothetical protein